jgi:flavin reductase (DIM6/NTAB) family NADH-FMN oxidoreductase RutF
VIRPATDFSASKDFVINLPTADIIESVDGCGGVSSRRGIDIFQRFNLTLVPVSKAQTPLIAEYPVSIEFKVVEQTTIGDHNLFLGKVLDAHVNEDKLEDSGRIQSEKLNILVYFTTQNRGEYWSVGKKIEEHGFTKRP